MLAITFLLFASSCVAQSSSSKNEEVRIDSAFNYYFKIIELEVASVPVTDETKHYYLELPNETDTLYMLKDLPQVLSILGEITGKKIKHADKSEDMIVTGEIANSWKNWYAENKDKLVWSNKLNRPILRKR
jgi:hypothetical protein